MSKDNITIQSLITLAKTKASAITDSLTKGSLITDALVLQSPIGIESIAVAYSNGIVTNSIFGEVAVFDFDVVANFSGDVVFTVDWGAEIGETEINATLVDGVPQSLDTSIEIPEGVDTDQTIQVTDSLGGSYSVGYTVEGIKILITMDMSTPSTAGINLTFASGSLNIDWKEGGGSVPFVSGVELTHTYVTPGIYIAEITGDLLNITQFIADNSKITFISNMTSGLLTNFNIKNNLYNGILNMTKASTSGTFNVDANSDLTGITHATSGNALITNYQYDGDDIQGNLDLSNQPVGSIFFGNNNTSHTGVTFAPSGNTKIISFRLHGCDLTGDLVLTNVPVGNLFWVYDNPNLTDISYSTMGNTIITDYRAQNIGLNSTLILTNVPIGNIFWVHDTNSLLNILFSATGNTALTACYCDDNALQNLDFSNFPTSTPAIRMFGNGMSSAEHDNQLINLDATGWLNGTLVIISGNTARTAASDAAITSLLGKGWTII